MAYSGFIIVQLESNLPISEAQDLATAAAELELPGLAALLAQRGIESTTRLVDSAPPSEATRLDAYWRLDVQGRPDQEVDQIVGQLNRSPGVGFAYAELTVGEPGVLAADPYAGDQHHLDPAPTGIDARWAWTQSHGDGEGVALIDVEQSWNQHHEDFGGRRLQLIHGDNLPGDHGTQVLGVIVAADNQKGVIGIAPNARGVLLSSRYKRNRPGLHVASAIRAAIASKKVQPGDVLLLEVVRLDENDKHWPTEVDPGDYDAIREAVAHGIIVIEAAGNHDRSLDQYTDPAGRRVLCREETCFRDSGAIMVGACESGLTEGRHNRWVSSNFGSRVDCHAWGENVVTCGLGDKARGHANNLYTKLFGGTSSASAIVAGTALLLQSIFKGRTGGCLSPAQMRRLLSNPRTGTQQGPWRDDGKIGAMPDLKAIILEELLVTPDVYVRDSCEDTGTLPTRGPFASSPDIIVCPYAIDDPDRALGDSSGTEDKCISYPLSPGQDNYIYVRIMNRGLSEARRVKAVLYWSEVATLITPDMWKKIGVTKPLDVPSGRALRVTRPLKWRPPAGITSCCLLAILDHPLDPAPQFAPDMSWDDFRALGRYHNNVAWRSHNVAHEFPAALRFQVSGANDRERDFELKVKAESGVPPGSYLDVPLDLWDKLDGGDADGLKILSTGSIRVPLASDLSLGSVKLARGETYDCALVVEGPVERSSEVVICQRHGGEEAGRITWLFQHREKLLRKRPGWARRFFRGVWRLLVPS